MKSRRMVLCSVALLAVTCGLPISGSVGAMAGPPASPLVMLDYTWSGLGDDDDWDHFCNWNSGLTCPGEGAPPDGTDDDATFPGNGGTAWAVDLVTEEIGDLTIEENVDFGVVSGTPTLEVNELVIDASSGDVSVSVVSAATIKTP